MRGLVCAVVLGLALTGQALGQTDWREDLKSDLVAERDGKLVLEEYVIYRLRVSGYEPSDVQVKFYSEAPADGTISRDNFVAYTTTFGTFVLLTSFAQAYQVSAAELLDGLESTELEKPIGTPDMELNIFMTGEGIQVELVDTATGQRSRMVETWEELNRSGSN